MWGTPSRSGPAPATSHPRSGRGASSPPATPPPRVRRRPSLAALRDVPSAGGGGHGGRPVHPDRRQLGAVSVGPAREDEGLIDEQRRPRPERERRQGPAQL